MEHAEKIRLLKGTIDEKRFLMNYFVSTISSGGTLEPDEIAMLEYLRTVFVGGA